MEAVKHLFQVKGIVLGFSQPLHPKPLNFEIGPGTFTAVLGRNGTGKSTLLSVLCGGEGRISGDVFIAQEKEPVQKLSLIRLSELVAFVPQEHEYPSHFRVVDLLGMALFHKLGMWGRMPDSKDARIQGLARSLSLDHLLENKLGNMSSGERQRVFLGRALLQQTPILVLDEPTNHLDPSGIEEFWKILVEVSSSNALSVVMSTHDLDFVNRYATHVLALGKEGILFHGTKETYVERKTAGEVFGIKTIV